jgi:hypothetical protein
MNVFGAIPFSSLSAFPRPKDSSFMAILKGYFDESACPFATAVAGYIGTNDAWVNFEERWDGVLTRFRLPYFHMKEFFKDDGPFARFKTNVTEKDDLFRSLVEVMRDSKLRGFGSSVLESDLRHFNHDCCQSLSSYALCVYTCIVKLAQDMRFNHDDDVMRFNHDDDVIEIKCDRIDKPTRERVRIDGYLRTNPFSPDLFGLVERKISYDWLQKDLTSRVVLPLQVADFIAWEARKSAANKVAWLSDINAQSTQRDFWQDYMDYMKESGLNTFPHDPIERKSLRALANASEVNASIWTYSTLYYENHIRCGSWVAMD